MEIYCDRCEFRRGYGEEPLPRCCPKCGWLDLWFEEDGEWNQLCRFWALANGWKGQLNSDPHLNSSLPEWYYREGKLLQWEWFKATLTEPENVGPPPVDQNDTNYLKVITAQDYWFRRTGIIELWRLCRMNIKRLVFGRGGKRWAEVLKIIQDATGAKADFDEAWPEERIQYFFLKTSSMIDKLYDKYMVYWEDRGFYTPPWEDRGEQYS